MQSAAIAAGAPTPPVARPGLTVDRAPGRSVTGSGRADWFAGLNALRYLFAAQIVLFHSTIPRATPQQAADWTWLRNVARFGYTATGFFITLSGFLLYHAYVGHGGRLRCTPGAFLARRLGRIYPLLVTTQALVIVLFVGFGRAHHPPLETTVAAVLALTGTQAWVPSQALVFVSQAWTISVLVFCYAIFPLLVRQIAGWRERRLVAALVVCWVLMLGPSALYLAGHPYHPSGEFGDPDAFTRAVHYFPVARMWEFVAGVLLARLTLLRRWTERPSTLPLATLAVAVLVTCIGFVDALPQLLVRQGLLAPVFWALLVGTCACGRRDWAARALRALPARRLGNATFSLYLIHQPALWAISKRYPVARSPLHAVVAALAFLVVASAASIVVHERFAVPAGDAFATVLARPRGARPAPPSATAPRWWERTVARPTSVTAPSPSTTSRAAPPFG